jgi:hypothetical protein
MCSAISVWSDNSYYCFPKGGPPFAFRNGGPSLCTSGGLPHNEQCGNADVASRAIICNGRAIYYCEQILFKIFGRSKILVFTKLFVAVLQSGIDNARNIATLVIVRLLLRDSL